MTSNSFKQWLIAYLRTPFATIVWFMETFAKNRGRLKEFMAQERVARGFKIAVVLTFLAWLVVFAFFASGEEGNRFSCAVKSLWSGFDSSDCPAQPWEQPSGH